THNLISFPDCLEPNLRNPASSNYTFISTSTPEGSSSFINASTVCDPVDKISTKRLCDRYSNCSRAFLFTCGPRRTVMIFFFVVSGIGPDTTAPVDFTV